MMHTAISWLGDLNAQDAADFIRAICIPLSVISAAISLRVAVNREYRTYSQLARFLGLATLCMGLALGQYHNLGQPPYWPVLIMLLIGVALSLVGTIPLAISGRGDDASLNDDQA